MTTQTHDYPVSTSQRQCELVAKKFEGVAPEVWQEIAEINFFGLRKSVFIANLSDEILASIAVGLVHDLVERFGGQTAYIPRGNRKSLDAKNFEILNEFNGKNFRELSLKHKITTTRIRQILHGSKPAKSTKMKAPD